MQLRKFNSSNYEAVIMRVDYNVPLSKENGIESTFKIDASIAQIKSILSFGVKVALMTHVGRPKGHDEELSTKKLVRYIEEVLGEEVDHVSQFEEAVVSKRNIVILENLRFDEREKGNGLAYAEEILESVKTVLSVERIAYINNAFATSHREHSSMSRFPQLLDSFAGDLLINEVENLSNLLSPERPYAAIMGGAKLSTKINILNKLIDNVNSLFVGGAMANMFYMTNGNEIGDSLIEDGLEETMSSISAKLSENDVEFFLPDDVLLLDKDNNSKLSSVEDIDKEDKIFDIGSDSINNWKKELSKTKTIFWNGNLGLTEDKRFRNGTEELVKHLATLENTFVVVGGGDSAEIVEELGLEDKINFISTGGGAALDFIASDGKLPVLEVLLEDAN